MSREQQITCGARHSMTGVFCELDARHAGNHFGEDSHARVLWPAEPTPPATPQPETEPQGVVLAARSYFERYSEATGHRFEIGELLRWLDSFYAGARWARRNPAADVGGPQSQTMAVSPPPASGDVEKLLAEKDRQIETLTQALERIRDCDWTIGRGDRMDPVRDIARQALAGTSRPTEGEQGKESQSC